MKVLSLFSGIGAFEKALKNLQIPFELVGFSEIDKYAVKSYCAIHNVSDSLNLGDITKIDADSLPKDIDLITYGFPCQDISLAGAQKGLFNADGTKTRSGLFFDALRIIETAKPKIAIAENVKNLTGKKFKEQFAIVLSSLESAGYNNYWKVLNAKDYGIPQNRERVFIVSIRKDIDNGAFKFPEGFPLEFRLKNFLEENVDEKYFLPFERVANLIEHKRRNAEKGNGFGAKFITDQDISSSLTTSPEKSSGAYLIVRENTKKGYAEAVVGDSINLEQPNSKTKRGRVGHGIAQTLTTSPQQTVVEGWGKNKNIAFDVYRQQVYENNIELPCAIDEQNVKTRNDGTVGCLTTYGSSPKKNNRIIEESLRIRKLTPKECFRLMGFDDADFEKAESVNSNNQLYKQAGNSIVVDVLYYIFVKLKTAAIPGVM